MAPGASREPIPPERAMVLASRREARGTPRAWLAALSIVAGIATIGLLFHTWPSHAPLLLVTSRAVAVMHAPAARGADAGVTLARTATVPDASDVPHRGGPLPPPSDVTAATPVSSAAEPPGAARSGAETGPREVTAPIEARPVTLVTMMKPVVVPEELAVVDAAPAEGASAGAPLALVARAVVAAGKGITTGFKLTGASIKAAF